MSELALRAAICEAGRRLWQRGLVAGSVGSIAARLDATHMVLTPAGLGLGHLRPDDLMTRSLEDPEEPEARLHAIVFAARKDACAAIHAHPPQASGLALAGQTLPDNLSAEAGATLGPVAWVPFAACESGGLEALQGFLEDHKTFLLSHAGALALGLDAADATRRLEALEMHTAAFLAAEAVGGRKPLPKQAFDAMLTSSLHGGLRDAT